MSKVVEALMENAKQDTELLYSLDEKGDDFSVPRDIDFLFCAPSQDRGELVTSFINDYRFGEATYYETEDRHCIRVVINMPPTQNQICSVSGFMTCIAQLYDLEYDGWGCVVQKTS